MVVKKTQNFELKQDLKEIKEIENLEKQLKTEIEQENQLIDSQEENKENKKTAKENKEETKEKATENFEKTINDNYDLNLNQDNISSQNGKFKNNKNYISFNLEDDLTPFDASQILLSFCKLKIVKPELFEALEAAFVKMLPIASPASLTAFAFAHSFLCTEMQMKFYENKKFLLKRSVKNLKYLLFTLFYLITHFSKKI